MIVFCRPPMDEWTVMDGSGHEWTMDMNGRTQSVFMNVQCPFSFIEGEGILRLSAGSVSRDGFDSVFGEHFFENLDRFGDESSTMGVMNVLLLELHEPFL